MTSRREFIIQSAGALGAIALAADLTRAAGVRLAAPLNVGLVGAGRQGRAIIAELQKMEGVTLAAICDSDATRLGAAARRATGAESFPDHRALLDKRKDISAIIIATPTHLHKGIALDAIQAGRHVYCEAPIAHTVDDCKAIAAAAGASKQIFACGLEGRSNPVYQLARTFFRSDAVRDLVAMEAQAFQKTSWRFPASDPSREKDLNWRLDPEVSLGLIGEMGVQALDVASWYTEQLPTSVSGHGAVRFYADGRTIADTVQASFAFPRSVRLGYVASLASSQGGRYELFRGSNATIKLAWSHGWMFKEADAPTQGWEVYANRQQFHNEEGITLIADATKLAEQGKLKEGVGLPNPSLYYALWNFVQAIAQGKPAACPAADGARSTIVAILAAQAVAKGTSVEISEDLLKV